MRPIGLSTKIFLDSGDPEDTKKTLEMLGFLDGQTTNPSLVVKKLRKIDPNIKLSPEDLINEYRKLVEQISGLIPQGSVSIEVYADLYSTAEQLLEQGKEMFSWIPNAHIKYPTMPAGLEAAKRSVELGMRVNMTLVFNQAQAAAVYAATKGAKKGDVFVSPFIGRLDDINKDGMDLVTNISQMYRMGDGHTQVLAASLRDLEHLLYVLYAGTDIVTAPMKILEEWVTAGTPMPGIDISPEVFTDEDKYLKRSAAQDIPFETMSLDMEWSQYRIEHELTTKGLEKFADDWNSLIL